MIHSPYHINKTSRVRVTYDVDIGGSIESKELPFIMGVISNFCGHKQYAEYANREFIAINKNNFHDVMQGLSPNLSVCIDSIEYNMNFHHIKDFAPDGLIQSLPHLQTIMNARQKIIDCICLLNSYPSLSHHILEILQQESDDTLTHSIDTAKLLMSKANLYTDDNDRNNTRLQIIDDLLSYVDKNTHNPYTDCMQQISDLDKDLSRKIDQILHHPDFLQLESTWRGLYDLVSQSNLNETLIIKIFSASLSDVQDDLSSSISFDYTYLFRLIYENEYGTFGGIPFGCLLLDYYMRNNSQDINMMRSLSKIASISHAPMLFGVASEMFNVESFKDLLTKKSIHDIFSSSEYAAWNALRDTEESRYINLFLPYVLMREPYGENNKVKAFNYIESINHDVHKDFCWGNPIYYMGIRINEAISKYGWAAAIRGIHGGVVSNLPTYTFKSSFGEVKFKSPLQIHITDRYEKELSDNGFIALCHKKMTNHAIFFSGQSIQRAKKYNSLDATANASIASRMTYMLNASRFAHYAQMKMRDKIGSYESEEDIRKYLQSWISQYVLLSDDADQNLKCIYPLREATILVQELTIGEYDINIRMRPHFQLEAATVSIGFVYRINQGQVT